MQSLRCVVLGLGILQAAALAAPASAARTPAPSAGHEVLPFIVDDYARALREARARNVPIVMDAWAPW